MSRVKGIGKSLAGVIEELLTRGEAVFFRELKDKTPPGLLELLRVPGLGPKKVRVLFDELHIISLANWSMPAGKTAWWRSPGSGPNPRRRSRPAWPAFERYEGLFRLGDLLPLAESLATRWRSLPGILRLEVAGPVRRRLEVAGAIDLPVAADHPQQVLAELERFLGAEFDAPHPGLAEATLPKGVPLKMTLAAPAGFGAAWWRPRGTPSISGP